MAYIKKVYKCGKVTEIEKVKSYRYDKKEERKREAKTHETSEAQEKINARNAEKKLRMIINTNFCEKDAHVILTYELKNRPSRERALDDFQKFIRTLRRWYKKLGHVLKYVMTAEYGKNSIHFHLVVSDAVENLHLIVSAWKHGRVSAFPLSKSGNYEKLAAYLIKHTAKTYNDPERRIYSKRFCPSTNLIIPVAKITKVSARSWTEVPVIPKNCIMINFNITVTDAGYPAQYYSYLQIDDFNQSG